MAQDSINVFLIDLFYKKFLCLNCVSDLEVGSGSTTVNKLEMIPALMERWVTASKRMGGAVKAWDCAMREVRSLLQQSGEVVKEGSAWR